MTLTAPAHHRYAGAPEVPGYSVGEFLGRGSTGVVWAATRRDSGEPVALKVLEPGRGPVDLEAVQREESLGQRVSGAHLLGVRGRVELADGRVVLVMDRADGGSLRDVVTVRGALPLGEVVTSLTPLATALSELHDAGVVHVDLAPGNVLFTLDGRPMLADLSSAWLEEDGWPQRSLGTPGFAAPEVVLGRPPVPASDVWSLAALAWYARTGGLTPPPWVGDLHWPRGMAGAGSADDDELESGTVDDVVAAVGPELTPLLVRMLADEPDARPSAAEAALGLYRAAAPEPVGLVGRHPDPAAAVTKRIRREAAETRSRAQLRAAERADQRRVRRERRRRRVRVSLTPWRRGGEVSPGRRSVRGLSWRWRLAVILGVGLVLGGGMLGLLRWGGVPLEVSTASVVDRSGIAPEPPTTTADGPGPTPTGSSEGITTSGSPVGATPTAAEIARAPVAALQRLADVRAAALVAADLVALAGAEPTGSSAYDNDVRTVTRLRAQGQRYAGLAFTVRSAEAVSVAPTAVVLRAVVDRSAYTVVGESGGGSQQVGAGSGVALQYTLTWAAGGWRLTAVGPA